MKYILYLLCGAMFVLCVVIMLDPKEEVMKVELARSGAWADRGAAISVDRSLRYNFYYTYTGPKKEPMSGYYTGRVSPQFWDTLSRKLEAIDLKTIPSADNENASDVNYFELIVSWKTGKRRIVRMRNFGRSDSLADFIEWLDGSYKRVKFNKQVDTIKFETTYQSGGHEADEKKFIEQQNHRTTK